MDPTNINLYRNQEIVMIIIEKRGQTKIMKNQRVMIENRKLDVERKEQINRKLQYAFNKTIIFMAKRN